MDFLPYLKKILELERRAAEHLGYEKNPYEALVELYEPEARVEWYEKIFEGLRAELVSLLGKIKKSKKEGREELFDQVKVSIKLGCDKKDGNIVVYKN